MKAPSGFARRGNGGFTTVYLLMILGSLVTAVVLVINAACGYAARSIVDNVCATAGRSVLSEFQRDLYEKYGIFAVRGDDALLTRLFTFYTAGSLVGGKALVSPLPVKISASAEAHPALDVEAFGKQVRRLSPGAALAKGKVLEYLMKKSGFSGLAGADDAPSEAAEAPLKSAEKSCSKQADSKKGSSIRSAVYKSLPSRLLGYPRRVSLVLSGGITDISFAAIAEDEYMMAVCSNTRRAKEGSYLGCELEYILYGNQTDAANRKALKMSLFTLRLAVNELRYASETGEFLASTAAAVALSIAEVKVLLSGGVVDELDLDMYYRILLALLPRNEKLARLMDVMELNIRHVKGANFAFKNYAYGFDLEASFLLKKRLGDVEQSFVYR